MRTRQKQWQTGMPGFTLFEILLVVVIGLVISGIGVIGLASLQTVFRVRSSADEIRSLVQFGRELAIANKDQVSYGVYLTGNIVKLSAGPNEISRFQVPGGVVLSPSSFSWQFTPLTGVISSCSPCQLSLSSGSTQEVINVQDNGLVN